MNEVTPFSSIKITSISHLFFLSSHQLHLSHATLNVCHRVSKRTLFRLPLKQSETTDRIVLDGLHRVIANIGAEHKISRADLQTIFAEVGEQDGAIHKDSMLKMI